MRIGYYLDKLPEHLPNANPNNHYYGITKDGLFVTHDSPAVVKVLVTDEAVDTSQFANDKAFQEAHGVWTDLPKKRYKKKKKKEK